MGDAAFLLIASEPKTGVLIMIIGFSVGLISGWIVDYTHPKGFLLPQRNKLAKSYKNAKPINVYGKKWGLYGYSDDEYDDSEEASSIVANGHNNKRWK